MCFGTVRVGLADQAGVFVVYVNQLAAIGAGDSDCAFVVPHIPRIDLREVGPLADTTGRLAFALPVPVKARATGQLALLNDMLLVIAIAFGFTHGIGGADQLVACVVLVTDQGLYRQPGLLTLTSFVVLGAALLIVHCRDVAVVVTQEQGAPGAIVDALDTID